MSLTAAIGVFVCNVAGQLAPLSPGGMPALLEQRHPRLQGVALPDLVQLESQWRSAWEARHTRDSGSDSTHLNRSAAADAIVGEECSATPNSPLLTCNVSITLCSPDGKQFTANASAYRNGTLNKAVSAGAAFSDPKVWCIPV